MTSKRLQSRIENYGRKPEYLLTEKGRDFLLALRRDHPEHYEELKTIALASGQEVPDDER